MTEPRRRQPLADAIKQLKEAQGTTLEQAKAGAEAQKKQGGRPRKTIDADQVWVLAAIQCTVEEIAAVCKCSVDTLERRGYADLIAQARQEGRSSLRREMWFKALSKGNERMQIWLSKQHLGMKDRSEVDALNSAPPLPTDEEAADQLAERFDRMAERLRAGPDQAA